MIDEILQAQRDLRSTLGVRLTNDGGPAEQWPDRETLGKLVEFFSALWEHLRSFDGDDRWLRHLPNAPYPEQVEELRQLRQQLVKTAPPAPMEHALGEALNATLKIAAEFTDRQAKFGSDAKPSARMQQFQDFLEGTKDMLIERESELTGPVPLILSLATTSKSGQGV